MKTYVWFYEWEEIPPSPVLWKTLGKNNSIHLELNLDHLYSLFLSLKKYIFTLLKKIKIIK